MVNMVLFVLLCDAIQIILGFDNCLWMPLWLAIRMSDSSMWALGLLNSLFILFDSCYDL